MKIQFNMPYHRIKKLDQSPQLHNLIKPKSKNEEKLRNHKKPSLNNQKKNITTSFHTAIKTQKTVWHTIQFRILYIYIYLKHIKRKRRK